MSGVTTYGMPVGRAYGARSLGTRIGGAYRKAYRSLMRAGREAPRERAQGRFWFAPILWAHASPAVAHIIASMASLADPFASTN